ncbi:MAG: NAD(P)H-dependent oxidoreductase [Alphaproteobacteria bacterium]|nr:NAD(P)H-dependent oxidoreductase [Alphaproteobacteria bacterium]
MTKLLFLSGSARKDSTNKKLARLAADIAEKEGAEVTYIDLKDFPMPIYDGDLETESGLPEKAIALKELFWAHDGFFIAAPEYNSSITPLLKNTLDWISRPHTENEESLSAYRNKVAALGAVAPGALGGLRGLVPLRMMLSNIMVHVVPAQVAVASGFTAFEEDGTLKDENLTKMLQNTIRQLVSTTQALKQNS